ncbi:MAG: M67 family metallopeptidase [bacterium]|nr:M67 family metallopeptidase [bacterium]
MLKITKEIIDKLYDQGMREAPVEACGYLAGKDSAVTEYYEMTNIDQSTEHFSLDPSEQFKVHKEVRAKGLEILAVYHTHPETPARPSKEDIKLAYDPDIIYVILSLMNKSADIKAFKIKKGTVTEEKLLTGEKI